MRVTGPAPAGGSSRRPARRELSTEEEQNKILARELHDVVSQRLAAVQMEIDLLERKPPKAVAELRATLRKVSGQIAALAETMHEISRQLHPAVLEDLGLAAALNGECETFSALYGNPVLFNAVNVPEEIPDAVALNLYRIAQESLSNVARHAPGAAVSMILSGGAGELTLWIEDTGPGFRSRAGRREGLGLISMQERARLVKGELRIASKKGKGTIVEVRVPLAQSTERSRRVRRRAASDSHEE